MNGAVRMPKIVRVVMLEQRREADALNVKISIRQKAGAPGAQGRTNAFATVPVGIHREHFLPANDVFGLHGAERKSLDQLFVKFRSEEHTSELQSHSDLVCRLLLEKKKE